MPNLIVLGSKSDIWAGLEPLFELDGWDIQKWHRDSNIRYFGQWDLVLSCIGQVAPVGHWWSLDPVQYRDCIEANLLPINLLRSVWVNRKPGASVCLMAGSNPQKIMPGYLPYNLSKMALLKAVEQIDYESPDTKVFALGPGYVPTKIHEATRKAAWPNERISRGDNGTSIDDIYACLKWCLSQDKKAVGARNICVSDPWRNGLGEWLTSNPNLYKLRRVE